jgi:hypothetical protein
VTGRLVNWLHSYGQLQYYVAGNWGEGSIDLHLFIQNCAEARVAHLARSSGRQESERLLGQLASTALRAQAMCLLARVGLITPAAKEAAERRQVAMRLQEELRRERKAQ